MARLRRVSSETPGISRHRRGRGFAYRDVGGRSIRAPETLERIRALAIPPAWTDVWICPDPLGHLRAAGTDAAGRRQYRYHDLWRRRRDAQKFDRMLRFAARLPEMRARVDADLGLEGMPRDRVLACAVRLLDRAPFRVGSEAYARANGSFGLATLRRDHVSVRGDTVVFDFNGKSGRRRTEEVRDPEVSRIVRRLKRRRARGPELLAYLDGRRWRDLRAADINAYLKEVAGDGFSAKDFRTWHGTVIGAVSLAIADTERTERTSRRRQVAAAVRDVAEHLGNTPAVARASYVDPRIIDRFYEGATIGQTLRHLDVNDLDDPTWRDAVERAVLELLEEGGELDRRAA